MEGQGPKKINPSGQEGHGVHVCHRCGWPFPNPHPSAKHRRAHKRICGTIEGFKISRPNDSDDEHLSGDDYKSPSITMEGTVSRKGSGGVGSRSNRSTRSEDDLFSDAVTDFPDNPSTEEASDGVSVLQRISENDLDATQLTPQHTLSDNLCLLNSTTDCTPMQIAQSISENHEAEVGIVSVLPHPVTDTAVEKDIITENEMKSSMASLGLDIDAEECKIMSDNNLSEPKTSLSESAEASGGVEKELDERVSFSESADDIVMMSEQSEVSKSEVGSPQVDSLGAVDASIDSLEAKKDVHVLAISYDLPLKEHPELSLEDFKDHKNEKTSISTALDLAEVGESTEGLQKDCICEDISSTANSAKPGHNRVAYSDGHLSQNLDPLKNELTVEDSKSHETQNISISRALDSAGLLQSIEHSEDYVIDETSSDVTYTKSGEYTDDFSGRDLSKDVNPVEAEVKQRVESDEAIVIGNKPTVPEQESVTNASRFILNMEVHQEMSSEAQENERPVSLDEHEALVLHDNSLHNILPQCAAMDVHSQEANVDAGDRAYDNSDDIKHSMIPMEDVFEVAAEAFAPCVTNDAGTKVEQTTNERDGAFASDHEKAIGQDVGPRGNETGVGGVEKVEPTDIEKTSESGPSLSESRGSMDGTTEYIHVDGIGDEDNMIMGSQEGFQEPESSGEKMEGRKSISVCTNNAMDNEGDAKSAEDSAQSLISGVPQDIASSVQSSSAENASGASNESLQRTRDRNIADSGSRADSLEGNWGSVSVLSAVSDTPLATDTEAPLSNNSQEPTKAEKTNPKLKSAGEASNSENSYVFWPSSFTTLVEPKESPGRKRNEEIIANVTNWSTGKQHAPLKTLLGEAYNDSKTNSPDPTEPDENPETHKGGSARTEKMNLDSEHPTAEVSKGMIEKEWNSPARYPVNIKTEKRKAKSKPYWVPFMCCSSVNAS